MGDTIRDRDASAFAGPATPPDNRERHRVVTSVREMSADGVPFYRSVARYCDTPGCRVDADCRSECGEDACPHCGFGGLYFTVREAPGGVWTYTCAECERQWSS